MKLAKLKEISNNKKVDDAFQNKSVEPNFEMEFQMVRWTVWRIRL